MEQKIQYISKIAIDLTPVLPGGDNGGAKLFVIELIRALSKISPSTTFLLLTNEVSNEELAVLDAPNVRRVVTMGATEADPFRGKLVRAAVTVATRLPGFLRRAALQIGYRLKSAIRRRMSRQKLREAGVDLLFCPFTATTLAEPGLPVVSTLYDLQHVSYPEFFSAADRAQREQTFRVASRRASVLAAISEYSRQAAIAYGGLEPSKVQTVHLRMAQRAIADPQGGEATLKKFGLKPRTYLIYPANFWRHKNHEMLLTAFGMARKSGLPANISLVFTGAPSPRQKLVSKAAKDLGYSSNVFFPGYVSDAELATLISLSRAVVFPSLYEGFGLPVLEAMALGVPVACSNVASLPEIAAGAALLFDPRRPADVANALVAIATNEAERERLIVAGRLRSADYSDSERMAREYWHCFERAVGARAGGVHLYGAHEDGWVGDYLRIDASGSYHGHTVRLELRVPPSVPMTGVVLRSTRSGKRGSRTMRIERGTSAIWSEQLADGTVYFDLALSPSFRPGSSELDTRDLTLRIVRCDVTSPAGTREIIHPVGTAREN